MAAEREDLMPPPNMAGQLTGRSVHIIEAVGGLADSARAKAILNESALDKIARCESEHAQHVAAQIYQQLKAEAGDGPINPKTRFALAGHAIRQLAGVLSSSEGLHNLRMMLERDWFKATSERRPATQKLVEELETCCHSPTSPHLPNDATLEPHSVSLDPLSQFRRTWDGIQIVFLVYIAIFVPFRVCFDSPASLWAWDFILDIVVDIYFALDIVLCFNTAYIRHSDGKLEWGRKQVTKHYLKTWFVIDFVASLPINYIPLLTDGPESATSILRVNKTARLLRFTKLLKLMRLVRIRRILERYEQVLGVLHSTASNSFQVLKLTAAIFLVGHILCCFWFLAGEDELHSNCTPDENESCIRTEGWITSKGLRDDHISTFDQYLMSLYWGMTTMTTVGYGDISAATRAEQIYCIVAMLIGGFMFGIIIGSLSNIIASASPLESNKKSRLAEIAEWLQLRAVPIHLRTDIYEYYRTMHTEGSETGVNEREILRELPHQMAKPLIDHMFTVDKALFKMECWQTLRLNKLPYFTQVEVALALRPLHLYAHHTYSIEEASNKGCIGCIRLFQKKVAYKEERQREEGVIFQEGIDDDRSIYIVQEGLVDITLSEDPESGQEVRARLQTGDCFGESCLLYIDDDAKYVRNYSAYAATDCKLLMLNREAIKSLPHAAIECFKPLAMRRQERIHAKAIEKLRDEGIIFDQIGNAITENATSSTSDAALITKVVAQTMVRMSSELKAIVREVLDEEKKEENELNTVMKMLQELNKKVDALATK